MDAPASLLKRIGLNNKEIAVFLSLFKLGSSTVSQVSYDTGITRTHIYTIVESLQKQGLVNEIEIRGVKQYAAIDYENLVSFISKKQKELEELYQDFQKNASEFHVLTAPHATKTRVRFFDGVAGIKSINAEIRADLQKQRNPYQFHVIFSPDKMEAILPRWIEENRHIYYEPLMDKYAIIAETPLLPSFLNNVEKNRQKNFHHKVWPKDKSEFPTDTLCWFDKIAYLDMTQHPSGIIIENSAIAETFRMWFQAIYTSLH